MRNPPHIRGVIPPETVRPRAAQQTVVAEFVKRWAPGEGSTAVTLRLQAEVRWHARQLDLEPEERAEFDAAVVAGMHQMAVALGVIATPADAPSFAPQDVARSAAMSPFASPPPSTSLPLPNRGVAP